LPDDGALTAKPDPGIADEARRLWRLYADSAFVAASQGDAASVAFADDPDNRRLRGLLGLVLRTQPPEIRPAGEALAAEIEPYVIRSFTIASHISRVPAGYAIGISPFTSLIGEIAFAIFTLPPGEAGNGRFETLDAVVGSYLETFYLRRRSELYTSLPPNADEAARATLGDYGNLGTVFALCHELAHIYAHHFQGAIPSLEALAVDKVPDDDKREIEADLWTFTSLVSLYELVCSDDRHPAKPLRAVAESAPEPMTTFAAARVLAVYRACDTLEAFYTAMLLLRVCAFEAGDVAFASRLDAMVQRKRFARRFIRALRRGEGPYSTIGLHEGDMRLRAAHDAYVAHASLRCVFADSTKSTMRSDG
jgi:hypothetical protein